MSDLLDRLTAALSAGPPAPARRAGGARAADLHRGGDRRLPHPVPRLAGGRLVRHVLVAAQRHRQPGRAHHGPRVRARASMRTELAPMYAQMLVGMVALTGQWWLEERKPPARGGRRAPGEPGLERPGAPRPEPRILHRGARMSADVNAEAIDAYLDAQREVLTREPHGLYDGDGRARDARCRAAVPQRAAGLRRQVRSTITAQRLDSRAVLVRVAARRLSAISRCCACTSTTRSRHAAGRGRRDRRHRAQRVAAELAAPRAAGRCVQCSARLVSRRRESSARRRGCCAAPDYERAAARSTTICGLPSEPHATRAAPAPSELDLGRPAA